MIVQAVCNRDCFNCPYEDCVVDGASALEIARSERRDSIRETGRQRNRTEENRRYRLRHLEFCREVNRRYYAAHRAEIAERKHEWYLANRERILAHQKDYRRYRGQQNG